MKVRLGKYPKNPDKERKLEVKIDDWDVWALDHTLSLIIYPALVKLKEVKHGSPSVDDADVPSELRSTSCAPRENDWETDLNWHKRWDWVLDEMIFAFKSEAEGWEDQFHHNREELSMKLHDDGTLEFIEGNYRYDGEGAAAYAARMQNGFRLFGKYYSGLWD